MIENLADLVTYSARRRADAPALKFKADTLSYEALVDAIDAFASGVLELGVKKSDRIAVLADKQLETVIAAFGATRAGGVFVPINPLFKPDQVAYILRDCNVRVLVTTASRLRDLQAALDDCPDLRQVIVLDSEGPFEEGRPATSSWSGTCESKRRPAYPRVIGSDMAAIMYTSGSTGKPKGVVLSHLNLTVGAQSVASYLENDQDDRILSVLPFSFDAGFSQLSTGFSAGSCVVLHNYLLPGDVIKAVQRERITGITGVPPLWMQLAEKQWPPESAESVRYFANTGGKMPLSTLKRLREIFSQASPYLMYGLTEAFRSTYLPPAEIDNRPESIGIAVPNVEVLVVADDGSICEPGEPGELVHRGPLVSLGYWNDPERTSHRFRPAPLQSEGICSTEMAVWSGDTVRQDDEGFLYFIGRRDDMIKTSGYRVSPTEIEEIGFNSGLVSEVAALGLPHDRLGQAIVLVAKPAADRSHATQELMNWMRDKVPNYMIPSDVHWHESLPRNANGKLDRKTMLQQIVELAEETAQDAS